MRFFIFISVLIAVMASANEQVVKLSFIEDFDEWIAVSDGTHYGDPSAGCQDDEQAFAINGVPGKICAPKCTSFQPCPTDVPDGVTAAPTCALKSPTGETYCALVCSPSGVGVGDGQCGDATCQPISNVGICTYGGDDSSEE